MSLNAILYTSLIVGAGIFLFTVYLNKKQYDKPRVWEAILYAVAFGFGTYIVLGAYLLKI